MNEGIELGLDMNGVPASIRMAPKKPWGRGLIINNETSASPRGLLLRFEGRNEVTRRKMERVRMLRDWDPRTFKLKVGVAHDRIRISGHDKESLPSGFYRLRLDIADLDVQNGAIDVHVKKNETVEKTVAVAEDPRIVQISGDLASFDDAIEKLLGSSESKLDELAPFKWLQSEGPRERRKACLLNLLAKLRTAPTAAKPLIAHVTSILFADVDRIYCGVDEAFYRRLDELSDDEDRNVFFAEGEPHSKTHQTLLHVAGASHDSHKLESFRQEGRPSMQATVAIPRDGSGPYFADVDLDLGNPLQDIAGFVIHMGEIVAPGKTDHFELRDDLASQGIGEFLYYTIR